MTVRLTEETQNFPPDHLPAGFRFAAVKAGIKPSGKPDFACAAAEAASAAAMFTSNRVVAAPVLVGRQHLVAGEGIVHVLAVNAGNANCATGEAGILACRTVCQALAGTFGCTPQQVFPSSTGIIGVPLPAEKLVGAIPAVQQALGATPEHFLQFADAILTTDTRRKIASVRFDTPAGPVRVAGVAKGAGMIAPQLVPHATAVSPSIETPEAPLASSSTVSLVEVSPSIEMQLNVASTAGVSISRSSAGAIRASVKM